MVATTASHAMTLALHLVDAPVTEQATAPVAGAAHPVENLSLVAALTCLMSAVYFLATSLVG